LKVFWPPPPPPPPKRKHGIYGIVERIDGVILTDLHVFSPLEYEHNDFEVPFECVWMCPSLALDPLDGFYSCSVYKSLCHRSVPGECERTF
jgi:hypothetical protein